MILLESGKFYHIYNRGINRCNLFYTNDNYRHFLRLYEKYIDPIADTFAWVLLRNHFHLLVRIKEKSEININSLPLPVKADSKNYERSLKEMHMYFSDLFNSYSQAINKQERRTGSLFQRPFRRIHVESPNYFKHLIAYIHYNPVHHGFTNEFRDYPWSSYGTILSLKPTLLKREKVIGWFNGKTDFINQDMLISSIDLFEKYIIE
jgi:putative transposase